MAITQNQVVDILYNAVFAAISKHFDETNRNQPQGKRLFFLIKEGIVNGVATLSLSIPIIPGVRTDSGPAKGEIPDAEEKVASRETLGEKTFAAPI
jgi:hypothetical protein